LYPRQTHSTPFHPTPPKIEGDFDCLFTLADLALKPTALCEGDRMVGATISHYKVLEKTGARLIETVFRA